MSGGIAVIEPPRTRKIQILLCFSLVFSCIILRIIPSGDYEGIPGPSATIGPPTAVVTIIHHIVVIVLAFRQRRKLYAPADIPKLKPITATAAVALSSWGLCCLWIITSMFYLMELGAPRHRTLFAITGVEAGFIFSISALCSREGLEIQESRDEQEGTSLVFMVDEHGERQAMEGP